MWVNRFSYLGIVSGGLRRQCLVNIAFKVWSISGLPPVSLQQPHWIKLRCKCIAYIHFTLIMQFRPQE